MTTNELVQEPHERLVEVLLEEEFRRARAESPRRQNSRWLAAAVVLLGLSVVGGVMVLRGGGDAGVAPVQDPMPAPKEPEAVALKTYAEFLALAGDVQRIRLDLVQSFGAPPAGTKPPFVYLPGATASIEDPAKVRDFVARIPKLADGMHGFRLHEETSGGLLTLELQDGRRIQGGVFFGEYAGFWLSVLGPAFPPPAPLLEILQDLYAQALANHRIAHGDTQSFAELAHVPATARAIRCLPPPPGSVAKHLSRFTGLERLHLEVTTTLGSGPQPIFLPTPLRLEEFAALRHLHHFQFPGHGLVDADAAALARMKNLTSVRIDGGLGDLSEIGARTLVRNLDTLELVGVRNAEVVLGAAIAAPRLRKLTLARIDLPPELFARLLKALVAMPTLVELDLGAGCWTDLHMAMLLKAKAPLACLRLQCTEVSTLGFGSLVALPSLRELDLRRSSLRPEALVEITKALPNCRIRRPGEQPEPTFPYVPAAARR